jgi:hypothetical protein
LQQWGTGDEGGGPLPPCLRSENPRSRRNQVEAALFEEEGWLTDSLSRSVTRWHKPRDLLISLAIQAPRGIPLESIHPHAVVGARNDSEMASVVVGLGPSSLQQSCLTAIADMRHHLRDIGDASLGLLGPVLLKLDPQELTSLEEVTLAGASRRDVTPDTWYVARPRPSRTRARAPTRSLALRAVVSAGRCGIYTARNS